MKLKTFFLAGMVSAAGALALPAADVFSVNAVGFVNITVPAAQFAIIANPLNSADNHLTNLLASAPSGVAVYRFDITRQGFSTYNKSSRGWSGTGLDGKTSDQVIFNPGEAFFIYNPGASPIVFTFVGEVLQGTALTSSIPSGYSMLASVIPQSDKLQTALGLPAVSGDVVYFFRGGGYVAANKSSRGWSGTGVDASGEPVPGVGEGFFFFTASSKTWTRNFSANN